MIRNLLRHFKTSKDGLLLTCVVKAGSKEQRVAKVQDNSLHICVQEPAKENRANGEITDFVAHCLGLPRYAVSIKQGRTTSSKLILCDTQMSVDEAQTRFRNFIR